MIHLRRLALLTAATTALLASTLEAQVRSTPRSSTPRVQKPSPAPRAQRPTPTPVQRSAPRTQRPTPTPVQRSAPRTQRPTPRPVQRSVPRQTQTVAPRAPAPRPSIQTRPRASVPPPATTPRSVSRTRIPTPPTTERPRAYRPTTPNPSSTRVTTPSASSNSTNRRSSTAPRITTRSATPRTERYRSTPTIRGSGETVRRAVGGTVESKSTNASRLRILHDRATDRAKATRIEREVRTKYERAVTPRTSALRPRGANAPALRRIPASSSTTAFAGRRYPVAAPNAPTLRGAGSVPRAAMRVATRSATHGAGQRLTPTLGSRRAAPPSASIVPTTHYAAPSKRAVYGHTHWGGHYATLSFAFGFGHRARWGCYSFPYQYCATLPSYYDHCWSSYGYYGRNFGLRLHNCFWPRWSFCWSSPLWGSYWHDPYDLYYSPGPSYVVVRESTPSVSVASAGGDTPVESLADVTERHLSLGDFYFEEGRYDEAAESYFRALAYAPDDGSIHFVIADALFAQGDYHFAAHMIRQGLQLDPTLVHAVTDKREFYGDAADFDAQIATLRKYVAEKPYDAAAQAVLGYNLWFSGERDAAAKAFERVREIDPANPIATAFLDGSPPRADRAESADDGVK